LRDEELLGPSHVDQEGEEAAARHRLTERHHFIERIVYIILKVLNVFFIIYHPTLWRDSISRPIDPVSSVAVGDDTTIPRRQGKGIRSFSATLQACKSFVESPSFQRLDPDQHR
jgi:hypothetical protein